MTLPDDEPTAGVRPSSPDTTTAGGGHRRLREVDRTSRRSRRRRTAAWVALAGGLALIAGGAIGQFTQSPVDAARPTPAATSRPSSGPALRTTPDADEKRAAALTTLLKARAAAVLSGDKAAFMAGVDPTSTQFAARQSVVFDNLRDVPFSDYGFEFAGVAPDLPADRQGALGASAWVARVFADYRIKTYDHASTQTEQYLTSVERDGRWLLVADTDGPSAAQPWDLGRVRVVRGTRVLAMGTADTSDLKSYASQGDRAVERVSKVWGRKWPRRAVLVVPRTEAEMGKLLLRTDGLDQIAAVTTGELTGDGAAGSDRVVINPSAFSRLGLAGRRVVLTHEMTHVAVRSSTSAPVPIWLSEGFADYVGYQGVGLGRRTVAADVLALVRQGEGPTELPTAPDFDPAQTTIAPSYSAAWLACSLISDRYGQAKLVELYRTVGTNLSDDTETAMVRAFQSVLGTTEPKFTKSWVTYMDTLAGS